MKLNSKRSNYRSKLEPFMKLLCFDYLPRLLGFIPLVTRFHSGLFDLTPIFFSLLQQT